MNVASPPKAVIASKVSLFSCQSTSTTFAPLWANNIAVALPIPNEAPVTNATLFLNGVSIFDKLF
jgi:hypothetical protein